MTVFTSRSNPWLSVGLPPRYLGAILCVLRSAISQVRKKKLGKRKRVKNTRIGIYRYRGGSGVTTNVIRPTDCLLELRPCQHRRCAMGNAGSSQKISSQDR